MRDSEITIFDFIKLCEFLRRKRYESVITVAGLVAFVVLQHGSQKTEAACFTPKPPMSSSFHLFVELEVLLKLSQIDSRS